MKIKQFVQKVKKLSKDSEFQNSVKPLIMDHLKVNELELFKDPNLKITPEQQNKLVVKFKELAKGKPLAQIQKKKEFYGRNFYINENVLIPRPETEEIVDIVSGWIEGKMEYLDLSKEWTILDVGTGSGCILLSIIEELKEDFNVCGLGVDVSGKALDVAEKNSNFMKLDNFAEFRKSDLFANISEDFDVIVANLPYIGKTKFNQIDQNVKKFEPQLALYAGKDGLDLYRRFFSEIKLKAIKFELLICEFGFGQEDLIVKIAQNELKVDCQVFDDLAGIPRFLFINTKND